MKVSNCCGDPGNKLFGDEDDGVTYKDVELCGKCLEHCEYVEEDDLLIWIDSDIIIKPETKEDD